MCEKWFWLLGFKSSKGSILNLLYILIRKYPSAISTTMVDNEKRRSVFIITIYAQTDLTINSRPTNTFQTQLDFFNKQLGNV